MFVQFPPTSAFALEPDDGTRFNVADPSLLSVGHLNLYLVGFLLSYINRMFVQGFHVFSIVLVCTNILKVVDTLLVEQKLTLKLIYYNYY